MKTARHELVVIGGGPAGYVAAIRAAQLGIDVACIDDNDRFGGTCLRVGCIPSKALLESSHLYEEAQHRLTDHGIQVGNVHLELDVMMARKNSIVDTLTGGIDMLFKKQGVTAYRGRGRFRDVNTVMVEGERVSSSRIREALQNADFALAEALLGRPFAMDGKVCYGRQLGRTLGVPTANVELHRINAPMSGVYAVEVGGLDGRTYHGVANVGVRPTVGALNKAILEVHLFDFSGDIYGHRISVTFRHKIRDERKFPSKEALVAQIRDDVASLGM